MPSEDRHHRHNRRRHRDESSPFAKSPDPSGPPALGPAGLSPSGHPASAPALDQFRALPKRLSVHPLELALLWVVAAHLVFLPWALGSMRPWAQWISFGFSVVSFLIALSPRNYRSEHTGGPSFRLFTIRKLLRFPIFWIGLLLLGLIVTQALNPEWVYVTNGKLWWMRRLPNIDWLPAGVSVPFARWGPWRNLVIYSSGLMTVCAIWVGFTRRRTSKTLSIILAINGLCVASFGIVQRLFGNGLLYWTWPSANPSFFGSFVYKNHAGAYLNVTLGISCALACWYFSLGRRRVLKSTPSGLFVFISTVIALGIFVSYARGATLIMFAYVALIAALTIIRLFKDESQTSSTAAPILTIILFLAIAGLGVSGLKSNWIWSYIQTGLSGEDPSVTNRLVVDRASASMLEQYWARGAGSGSFQFLFPVYQQHYPEILQKNGRWMFWEHAHNDFLELPIELGITGAILILAAFIYWVRSIIRGKFWGHPLCLPIVLSCGAVVVMSSADFVFENPATLITWCAVWPIFIKWMQIEREN